VKLGIRRRQNAILRGSTFAIAGAAAFIAASVLVPTASAGCQCGKSWPHLFCRQHHAVGPGDPSNGGQWFWMGSPELEQRVVANLYDRYCIRCHGVDGRGVWDIPDIPDFTNLSWQGTRPDPYRTRVILEGRGAVMPAFRGTLTLAEACALGRYLYTFIPENQASRPDLSEGTTGEKPPATGAPPTATPASPAPGSPPPSSPAASMPGPFVR
jgi:mono/diheme cytochrome c family protein